ncbi:MAG: phosphatidylcholine/phosphatidylserine synthase [Alphaproteobacteria bacterium]|nr:phosphatidylcholine/phosphatidylserine synthase [Alphaproteobacteria bacterium]
MIQHFLNPPNWFTSASLFCSVYALTILSSGPEITSQALVRACVLVVFGGIFDLLDGRVARLTKRQSAFGLQLDSIADVIGFGVAPAMVAWAWKLHELHGLGVGVAFWYVLCVAFRLARFNVVAQEGSWPLAGHTQGLTSTMSGGILVSLVWVGNGYLAAWVRPPTPVFAAFVGVLGYLMISSIPFRNFKDMRSNVKARWLLAMSLGACLTSALVFDPSMLFAVGATIYLVGGLLDGLAVAVYHRRLGQALLVAEDDDDDDEVWTEEHR